MSHCATHRLRCATHRLRCATAQIALRNAHIHTSHASYQSRAHETAVVHYTTVTRLPLPPTSANETSSTPSSLLASPRTLCGLLSSNAPPFLPSSGSTTFLVPLPLQCPLDAQSSKPGSGTNTRPFQAPFCLTNVLRVQLHVCASPSRSADVARCSTIGSHLLLVALRLAQLLRALFACPLATCVGAICGCAAGSADPVVGRRTDGRDTVVRKLCGRAALRS